MVWGSSIYMGFVFTYLVYKRILSSPSQNHNLIKLLSLPQSNSIVCWRNCPLHSKLFSACIFWTTVNDSVTFYSVPMPKAPIFYFSKKFNLLAVTFFFFFWLSFFYLITCFTHCRPPRFGEVMREPVLISRITWKMNLCCHAFSLLGTPYTMEISLHIMEDSICIYQILFVLREHRLSFDFRNWLLHTWLVTLDY